MDLVRQDDFDLEGCNNGQWWQFYPVGTILIQTLYTVTGVVYIQTKSNLSNSGISEQNQQVGAQQLSQEHAQVAATDTRYRTGGGNALG